MLKPPTQSEKLFTSIEEEILEKLVDQDHVFRKLNAIVDFAKLLAPYTALYSETGAAAIDLQKGFKGLLLQFWEDYSDREMERAVKENVAIKWFCGFALLEKTPDHSYFGKLRARIGTSHLAELFNAVNAELKTKGLFGNVFKFIDASAIVSKTALWEERDRAIEDGAEKLNNANVAEYAADTDARWGAKSDTNIWFGYKRVHAVDMRYGLIEKLAVTPANVLDFQVLDQVCPEDCMVFTDKLFDCKKARLELKGHRCHAGIIRKNTNKEKNRDLDRWLSRVRMPFEGTFSKLRKRAKFRGKVKVLFQCFAEAICHNLKKAVMILPMPVAP